MPLNSKYYQVADITIEVRSDLPVKENTFHPKFKLFERSSPGKDNIVIHHHFDDSSLEIMDHGVEFYNRIPWIITFAQNKWIYRMVAPAPSGEGLITMCRVVFDRDHSHGHIYNGEYGRKKFLKGNADTLTLFISDQILLARILAFRDGCMFHSEGIDVDGKGCLFMGHSGAGKTTIAKMFKNVGCRILCDDRMIVRKYGDDFFMYGSWCHGGMPEFSDASLKISGIFFLNQSKDNKIVETDSSRDKIQNILSFMVRPFVTKEWWEKNLSLTEQMVRNIHCYNLFFDKSGDMVHIVRHFISH